MGLDLDISIQPTAVTASFSRAGTPSLGRVTVWQAEERQVMSTRELLYADDDSEDLFNEISRSQNSPSWLSTWGVPTRQAQQGYKPSALSQPVSVPKLGPVPSGARSTHSSHSRSSSYASTTSSHSHHSHHSASHYPNQANVNPEFGYPHAMDRPGSSNSSNASGSPRGSVYSLSEDGSSGSSGLSWTRRGTVVPGPQQSAILAARQAHAQAQGQVHPQMKGVHPAFVPAGPVTEVQLPPFGLKHQQPQQPQQSRHHRTSPSASTSSVGSTASGHSGGSANGGNKHRRQRSTSSTVVIDPTKASVTAYDGGKTKVVSGGVMLGGISGGSKKKGF